MTRKKFKVMYPDDHPIKEKRNTPFIAPQKSMIVMGQGGVFFLIEDVDGYMTTVKKLSEVLPKYDVVWK